MLEAVTGYRAFIRPLSLPGAVSVAKLASVSLAESRSFPPKGMMWPCPITPLALGGRLQQG